MRKGIIKPIETEYNGYLFRSKLEAQWAVVFDSLGIRYEYEPEGFELEDGTRYLPDFYFPEQDTYGEVKPDRPGALEELFDKSLKFVENGTIERLIILPNIPAATKKDPVWWVPLIQHNPFASINSQHPFETLRVSKALIEKRRISVDRDICRYIEQEMIGYYIPEIACYASYFSKFDENSRTGKSTIKALNEIFLNAVSSQYVQEYLFYDDDEDEPNKYKEPLPILRSRVLEHEKIKNKTEIMSAFRRGRQARFDHGQTPEVKSAG